MEYTVFYSWQSDLPRKLARDVVRGAASSAVQRIAQDVGLEDSPRLDSDTENVSGSPDIANTIYGKIEKSDVFIADVSIVGKTEHTDPNKKVKSLSNPNVLLELGYAAAKLGWERIVLVMNTAYGAPEELPFDLKNRRFPITYKVGPDSRKDVDAVQAKLSEDIEFAIRSAIRSELGTVDEIIATLDSHSLKIMRDHGAGDGLQTKERDTTDSILAGLTTDFGIPRLLDRKVLVCIRHPQTNEYVYIWTHLGKLVLESLGFRPVANERRKP